MENQDTAEVLELVKNAQSKGKFDITAFAKGRAYPEDSVTTFLDVQSAYDLTKINDAMRLTIDEAELEKLSKQAEPLAEKIKESKLVFKMRGVSQAHIEQITKDCDKRHPRQKNALGQYEDDIEWLSDWTIMLVASNIVHIENAAGEIDEGPFTLEKVSELRLHLPKEVWDLLVDKMQKLTLATAYFEGMTDAGFLPKS